MSGEGAWCSIRLRSRKGVTDRRDNEKGGGGLKSVCSGAEMPSQKDRLKGGSRRKKR